MVRRRRGHASIRPPWVASATATVSKRRPAADAGETNGDSGAFTDGTADRNGSPVFLNDFFDAGETQPDSGTLGGEKWLEDLVDDFSRDGNPVVLNENLNFEPSSGAMLGDLDMEMATGRHGLARVPEDAQERLLKFGFIAAYGSDNIGVVFGDLNTGRFQVCSDHHEGALKHLRNTAQMATEFQRLRKVEDLVQYRFNPDQVAHCIFDTGLWIEVEDSFTGHFFKLRANGRERLSNLRRQERAELHDRGLSFLLSNNGLRRGGHGVETPARG